MHVEFMGQTLQIALLIHGADQAVLRVVGQQQAQHGAAGADRPLRVGLDDHAFRYRRAAGRRQSRPIGKLHHANTTGAGFVFNAKAVHLAMAQGGNLDPEGLSRFQNGRAFRNGNGHIVNLQVNHCHYGSYLIAYQ
jgi:hypothetical protein